MSAPYYQSEPQIQYLYQILRDIAQGQIQVPRFQRPFVWDFERRLELFRSLHAGMPIGSIMIWKTNELDVRCYRELGPYKLKQPVGSSRAYLIDGHQRLATLFDAFHNPDDDSVLPDNIAYFNIESEEFFFEQQDTKPEPMWLPLRFVADFPKLLPFQRGLGERPNFKVLLQRIDSLVTAYSQFKIPVLSVSTNDLDMVAKTFQRINSQGVVMSEVHMISALTWSEQFDLNERIANWKEEQLSPIGWGDLEDKWILYACKVALGFDQYEGKVDEISKRLRENPDKIEEAAGSLVYAAQFLRDHCGIRSPWVMPYTSHIVPLAEAFRRKPARIKGADRDALIRWFWLLTYSRITRTEIPRLLLALDLLCGAKAGPPPIPLTLPSPLFPLPKRFRYNDARCMALTLHLAALSGDGPEVLARHEAEAAPHLFYGKYQVPPDWFPSPANRIVADPKNAPQLREAIAVACAAGAKRSEAQKGMLAKHAIPPDAADAFKAGKWDGFFSLRLRELERLENEFATRLGILQP